MTRTQLADTAKISRATLAKNEPVSMEVLLRIAMTLSVIFRERIDSSEAPAAGKKATDLFRGVKCV